MHKHNNDASVYPYVYNTTPLRTISSGLFREIGTYRSILIRRKCIQNGVCICIYIYIYRSDNPFAYLFNRIIQRHSLLYDESKDVWRRQSSKILGQLMACCLTTINHYLNHSWLTTNEDNWHWFHGSIQMNNHDIFPQTVLKWWHLKSQLHHPSYREITYLNRG